MHLHCHGHAWVAVLVRHSARVYVFGSSVVYQSCALCYGIGFFSKFLQNQSAYVISEYIRFCIFFILCLLFFQRFLSLYSSYCIILLTESSTQLIMKMHKKRIRCQAAKQKRKPRLSFSFSNVRGLRSNYADICHFLQTRSPDLLALSETRLDASIPSGEFTPDGYTMHRLDNAPCHGLALYAKPHLPLFRLGDFEDHQFEFLVFLAPLESRTLVLFFLYRSPSSNCELLDVISDKIDRLLSKYPSAEVAVFGDFNVHNTEWLVHSRTTDVNGQAAHAFAVSHNLTQIVDCPTRVPDRAFELAIFLITF